MKPHHRLVTRRDFLAQGLISFSAVMAVPKLHAFDFLGDCGGMETGTTYVPFMSFDMAGGAALPANFLVGKTGGPEDLLMSYDRLGWDPKEAGALNTEFGLPMSIKYSKILQGILTNTSAEARLNFRMGSFCHFAQDDTSSNKLNAASLVLKAGFRGSYISNGLGIVDTISGGNSSSAMPSAVYKPTFVRSVTDVTGSASFGGNAFKDLNLEQMKAVAEAGISMSLVQKMDYAGNADGDLLGELSKCAYEKNRDFLKGVGELDPRTDATTQGVYQINQNSNAGDPNTVAAALAMNTIKATSGPSVWTLGGCDYHDGTQASGDNKDLAMGVQMGRAIELAHRLKKPFFFQLFTDGGCDASVGTRNWRGDSGDKCMTVIGYYNPKGAQKMIRKQVGHFTNGQGAERSTVIGSDPALVAHAVLANYLNICGKLSDFASLAPGVFTAPGQLDSVLIFEGKA